MWNPLLLCAAASLALPLLQGCSSANPTPDAPAPLALTVLHLNDHHSTLAEQRKTLQLPLGDGTPEPVTVSAGGFARVTQAMHDLASAATTPVIKLHAGDALTGSLYFNRAGAAGEADAALMNTVCFDAFALGNHEFDHGDAVLRGFLERLNPTDAANPKATASIDTAACRTQAVSANVRFGTESALHPSRAGGLVRPGVVIERGGHRIGVVGLTIAAKTRNSSNPDAGTTFEDERTAAQREIDALTAQGVPHIVLLSHVGHAQDRQLAAQLRGVDVVVGGDSHTLLGPAHLASLGVGSPTGDYPTQLHNADGDPVCVVQAWHQAQVVGELRVAFDETGRVTACEGTPHVLIGSDFQRASGAALDEARAQHLARHIAQSGVLRLTAPHPLAAAVLQPYSDALAAFTQTRVAHAPEALCLRRMPGGPGESDFASSTPACNALGHVTRHGGDVQQLAVQAYLDVMRRRYGGADIALQNAGAVRTGLEAGPISAAQVLTMLSFGNQLVRFTLTADEVKGMLEDALHAVYGPRRSTGSYPYTAGLRFEVAPAAPRGERVRALTWHDPSTQQWVPLPTDRTYELVTIAYSAEGRDGYETLGRVPAQRRLDVGVLDADAFLDHVAQQPAGPDGLPLLHRLPTALYSTQALVEP